MFVPLYTGQQANCWGYILYIYFLRESGLTYKYLQNTHYIINDPHSTYDSYIYMCHKYTF